MIIYGNKIILLSGPSGIGKTSTLTGLRRFGLRRVTPTTTRARRKAEDPLNYHFLSFDDYASKINNHQMLLSRFIFDNFYGYQVADLIENSQVSANKLSILEVYTPLLSEFKTTLVNAKSIIMLPYDLELINQRMTIRGDDPTTVKVRLQSAQTEIQAYEVTPYLFDEVVIVQKDDNISDVEYKLVKAIQICMNKGF
jgi:guanylate kinase